MFAAFRSQPDHDKIIPDTPTADPPPAYVRGPSVREEFIQTSNPAPQSCWPGLSFSFFNPFASSIDRHERLRRVLVLVTLLLDTAVSILIIFASLGSVSVIPRIIWAVLGFLGTAYCLFLIGTVEGTRTVCGVVYEKRHFDAFLGLLALYHVGLVFWLFFGRLPGGAFWGMSAAGDLALFGVAWVAWWGRYRIVYVATGQV